jgi:RimJ/RimL family protein N-acetyltransferase
MENNITKYGVVFKRLTFDKIEMVRNWRNDTKVSQYMDFRDYITPQMQEKWFETINNNHNYYFIIEFNTEEIGLVNIKNINFFDKCGESGIFIYDNKYLNTDVGIRCGLCQVDFAFEELKLNYLYGHIMNNNKRAIRFNRAFGCILDENQEGKEKQRYLLYRDKYFEHRARLIGMLPKIN